ncbi:MAG TPA: hypothetical protein VHA52_01750 [Candidatus Babeliaceae bacterium]|nr:hypothetical protein [Candidatus Babeliaceae bacterium]
MFSCLTTSYAQLCKGQYDISPSVGLRSGMAASSSDGYYDISQSPNFFASGRYYITNRFAVGAAVGFQRFGGNDDEQVSTLSFNENDFTLAIEATLAYIRKDEFQMYGFFGIGPDVYTKQSMEHVSYYSGPVGTNYTTKNNTSGIRSTEQFTPLGFRFGDDVAVFVELGYGYKGIFNGGLAFSIGKNEEDKRAELNKKGKQ